jgi:hypothetical protein
MAFPAGAQHADAPSNVVGSLKKQRKGKKPG